MGIGTEHDNSAGYERRGNDFGRVLAPNNVPISASLFVERASALIAALTASGMASFDDWSEIGAARERIAAYKPPSVNVDSDDIEMLYSQLRRGGYDPAAHAQLVDQKAELLTRLERNFPEVSFIKNGLVELPLARCEIAALGRLPWEVIIYQVDGDSYARFHIGEPSSAYCSEVNDLGRQGRVPWSFHNHPDERDPFPSHTYGRIGEHGSMVHGDLTSTFISRNAIVTQQGVMVYVMQDGFNPRSEDFADLYRILREARRALPEDYSQAQYCRENPGLLTKLEALGLELKFFEFSDPTWEHLDALLR